MTVNPGIRDVRRTSGSTTSPRSSSANPSPFSTPTNIETPGLRRSPSTKSVRNPPRAKLTASWAANELFPSPLSALVINTERIPAKPGPWRRKVRVQSTDSARAVCQRTLAAPSDRQFAEGNRGTVPKIVTPQLVPIASTESSRCVRCSKNPTMMHPSKNAATAPPQANWIFRVKRSTRSTVAESSSCFTRGGWSASATNVEIADATLLY